jgi:hypothetical protein
MANLVDINPSVVIPYDIPLPLGYKPNIPLIIPVPGGYDPDDVFGDIAIASTTTLNLPTTTVMVIYTTTYTSFSTYPVTTTNSIGQMMTIETSSPVITTSIGTSTSKGSDTGILVRASPARHVAQLLLEFYL